MATEVMKRGLIIALSTLLALSTVIAQESALPRDRFRGGSGMLHAFASVSDQTRKSVVKFNVDGETVALGTVVDEKGLALTKASEIKKGKLTCWLANEVEVPAELLAVDEDVDLALVRIKSKYVKPIRWATGEAKLGQWAITPGIADTPQAVGIVSAKPRRIRPPRSLIGIIFEMGSAATRIQEIMPGFGAEKAGLKEGDVILSINGNTTTNREQVIDLLREMRAGQLVSIKAERADKDLDFEVQLMPAKEERTDSSGRLARNSRVIGELSTRAEGFEEAIEHDTVLQPWLCGGPLVDLDGKAIGLNIARAGRASTYALPHSLVERVLSKLKSLSHI